MKKYGGTRYDSLWDWSTWLILVLIFVCSTWPALIDDDRTWQIIMLGTGVAFLALAIVFLKGIYYRIDGNNLIVYQFFVPTAFPIDKIESVKPDKSIISAPATSFANRIAIRFSDRKILKSAMPLLISPARQQAFIAHLLTLNPHILT